LASVGGENSTFVVPDAGSPDSLSLMLVDVGLQLEIGSPNKTHGRAFLTLEQEMRTGSSSSFEYDRIRLLLGVALVY
jgi:hypothetical protein